MKKHQALQAELAGHEPRIQNVCSTGQIMIKEGHFAQDTIASKIRDLQDRWQQLKVSKLDPICNIAKVKVTINPFSLQQHFRKLSTSYH